MLPPLILVALILLLSFATLGDATTVTPDEARWKDGELLAPLPADPAAALEAVRMAAAALHRGSPSSKSVRYTSSGRPAAVVYPVRVNRPAGNRPLPTADPESAQRLADLYARLRLPVRAGKTSDEPGRSMAVTPSRDVAVDEMEAIPPLITFDGIDWTGLNPGSPDIAVGPNHLLIATTDRFAVMNKSGSTLDTDLFRTRFNLPATHTYYFPKVVFDMWTPRWIMVYHSYDPGITTSVVHVAVSETANPLGEWFYYALPSSPALPGLRDDVSVAVTPEQIYITWNRFNLSNFIFEGAVILELVKADAYAGAPVTLYNYTGMTNPNDGSPAATVRPAQMRTFGGDMFFVNSVLFGDDYLTMWKLTGDPGASVLTGYNVPVPAYVYPTDMVQPGATLVDVGDCRIRDAVYSSGSLYAAHNRLQGPDLGPTIEVRRIDVVSATSPEGASTASSVFDFAYPAIDIDEDDQITIGFCQCGPTMFLSVRYAEFTMDPLVAIDSGDIMLGLASFQYGASPYPWGPYFGVALDPFDGSTAWVHGLYASNNPVNTWTSRVGAINANLTPVTDEPGRVPTMLLAPAPNPGSAMVRFGYSVEEAGEVEIAIYDVAGKRVAQVARKYATKAGADGVDFDTTKLSSGVYFVKLSTPTKSASRKFVVTH